LDRGFYHQAFITDSIKDVCQLDSPFVLLHRGKLEKGDAVVNLFKQVFSVPANKLLIITDDIDPFILQTMIQNINDGVIRDRVCVVKTPQILKIEKDLMSDVAILTGAKVVSDVDGVKLRPDVLGRLQKAVMTDKDTLLVGNADNLTNLVEELKEKISITKNKFDKLELQERLSRITGGVATLYVGAKSDSELKEKQDRIEDSINATRSALEEGIVPGGGVALQNASAALYQERGDNPTAFERGYDIVLNACLEPEQQICENAGILYGVSVDEGWGINVKTGENVDMVKAGIIDPTKVTRCAIENASSVASTFLTTEVVIAIE
jgi:chaperonin GroEL